MYTVYTPSLQWGRWYLQRSFLNVRYIVEHVLRSLSINCIRIFMRHVWKQCDHNYGRKAVKKNASESWFWSQLGAASLPAGREVVSMSGAFLHTSTPRFLWMKVELAGSFWSFIYFWSYHISNDFLAKIFLMLTSKSEVQVGGVNMVAALEVEGAWSRRARLN